MPGQFSRLIAPYLRMIRMTVSRGVIKKVNDDPKMQEMQVKMLKDETYSDLERFQEYGFTSVPHPGGETIEVSLGGDRAHTVIIKADDRRYRLKGLKGGEVAMYTDEGDKIHLKRGKEIEIICGNKLTATVENDVEITTKRAKISASEKCEIESPDIKLTSDSTVKITGDSSVTIESESKVEINCNGQTIVNCDDVVLNAGTKIELGGSAGTMRSLIDERLIELFNAHTHGGLVPTSPLTLEAVATTITKAG